jgi:glucose-6-phosphate isomerase
MSKLISYNYENCLHDTIGDPLGLTEKDFLNWQDAFSTAKKQIDAWRADETYGFIDLPTNTEQLDPINEIFAALPAEVDTLLHVGIGGSSLGPIAIQQALDNRLTAKQDSRFKQVFIQENVDPESFSLRMDEIDFQRTAINVVSKSGGTIETLASFTAAKDRLAKVVDPAKLGERIIICTENQNGVLAGIANDISAHLVKLPHNVGGRFSVLTAVGLLPAIAMGLNAEDLLKGAADMREQCLSADGPLDPCFLSALIPYLLSSRGVSINVLFPYSDLLRGFALWCCQLLGESLGKRQNRAGEVVNVGQTPTPSVGAVDQHSLLQLYMEGPADKLFTFMRLEEFRSDVSLANLQHSKLDEAHVSNLSMGALINAEQLGTATALAKEGRPNITLGLPALSAHVLGQLFYFFELATAYGAELYNIDAFDQPGVEASKKLTISYLRQEN